MARTAQHSAPVSSRVRVGLRRAGSTALAGAASLAAVGLTAPAASAHNHNVWDRVAMCESSGDWHINTGNGYYGGLQFYHPTWTGFGGREFAPYAHQATKLQQITVAQRVLRVQGPGAWPVCSVRAGLTLQNGLEPYPGEDEPAPPPPPPGEPGTWWVSANTAANIRSGPGTGYAVVGSSPRGTQVSGTASGGWVRLSDGRGYISLSVLTDDDPGGSDPAPPPPPRDAGTWWVSANYAANIRSGPGMGYAVVGSSPRGTKITGTASNGWVRLSDGRGWIGLSVLTDDDPGGSDPAPAPPGDVATWRVSASVGANIRSGPGTGYSVVGGASFGTQVSGTQASNGWVQLADGRGWISGSILTRVG